MTYRSPSQEPAVEKPYAMVNFPGDPPKLERPAGQDRFRPERYHGKLFLVLEVKTPVHISTGVSVPGSDLKLPVSLVKTMARRGARLAIPGSSLKGVVRSLYETVTNSTLAVVTPRSRAQMPQNRLPCRSKEQLCPASRVFGAMDWQGLIRFSDAVAEQGQVNVGFMPSLYQPRPQSYIVNGRVSGRKFYYHTVSAVTKTQERGIAVLQAPVGTRFKTTITFANLTQAELGALLTVLGQDTANPIALKIGGGKPIGMGTAAPIVEKIEYLQNLRERYLTFDEPGTKILEDKPLADFIAQSVQAASAGKTPLILSGQLRQLASILAWPTKREPPSGMY